MSYAQTPTKLPAPCIVDVGTIVNKQDMQKLLMGLGRVRYSHSHDDRVTSEGEGVVVEVFADDTQATLVANRSLYLNVCSFDYLEIDRGPDLVSCFRLVQDQRRLELSPLSNPLEQTIDQDLDEAALEAVFDRVLLTKLDSGDDDDDRFFW